MIQVRPFLNSDPPAIAKIINDCCNLEATISPNLLEYTVFAKTYFSRDRFFVATIAGEVVGFAHLGSVSTDHLETRTLTISNFLVRNCDTETATALLDSVRVFAQERGFTTLRIGSHPNQAEYYNGVSSHFLNVGIPSTQPILPVLHDLGFSTVAQWHCLQFAPQSTQIPFTRQQMTLRRSHQIGQDNDPEFDSFDLNAIYSHLATSRLTLTDRLSQKKHLQLTYACLAQSFPNWPSGGVDVVTYQGGDTFVAEHYEFLLCELLRQLAQTNLSPLRIHLGAQQEQARATAEEIGFEHTITSAHIELRLDH